MFFVLKSFASLKSKEMKRSNPSEPLRCMDIYDTVSVLFSEVGFFVGGFIPTFFCVRAVRHTTSISRKLISDTSDVCEAAENTSVTFTHLHSPS